VLNQTISYEKRNTVSGYGAITYDDPVTIPCYVAGMVRMVRNLDGEEVVSTVSVYINGTDAASKELQYPEERRNDRITLPDGRQPAIMAITPYWDDKGDLYAVEVNL
jgi:hypothetical protein